jgi:hypothetical protein
MGGIGGIDLFRKILLIVIGQIVNPTDTNPGRNMKGDIQVKNFDSVLLYK